MQRFVSTSGLLRPKINITNLSPSEIWNEIKGKAHLYQTAKLGTRYVKILRIVQDGTFSIQHPVFGEMHAGCHELTDYCL